MILEKGKLVMLRMYECKCYECESETSVLRENLTREIAKEELADSGWKKKKGKWYCRNCNDN